MCAAKTDSKKSYADALRIPQKRKTQSPHSKLPESDIYQIPYKKQYVYQQPDITWYPIKQKDVKKLRINQVGDAIKQSTTDEELRSSFIRDRHLAYDNLNVPINKDLNTISDLIEKSNGPPMISFTFDMKEWMEQNEKDKKQQQEINKQFQEEKKYVDERFKRIEKDNEQLKEDNKNLKNYCLHKILIRQVRKEMKEEILKNISKKINQNASFEDKCKLVSDDLNKLVSGNLNKSMLLSCLWPTWTKGELDLLFNNPTYNKELNDTAHPNFREDTNLRNELREACYGKGITDLEKINFKCYNKLYGKLDGSRNTNQPTTSKRT
jgi:hypothetical protein